MEFFQERGVFSFPIDPSFLGKGAILAPNM